MIANVGEDQMLKTQTDSHGGGLRISPSAVTAVDRTRLTVSVREAVVMSGLSRSFLYEAMNRGELPFIKKGRRRLIATSSLSEYVLRSDQ